RSERRQSSVRSGWTGRRTGIADEGADEERQQGGLTMRGAPEAEVVHSLKQHLKRHGLWGRPVGGILVDADGSYRASPHAAALEPMACVPIDGARLDLLCSLVGAASRCLVGFEVKPGLEDWRKGLAQAAAYRAGVHYSFL